MKRVLHIEVGGSYGGSVKCLDLYLRNADPAKYEHSVLLYYGIPGGIIGSHVTGAKVLERERPSRTPSLASKLAEPIKHLGQRQVVFDALDNWRSRSLIPKLEHFIRFGQYNIVHINNSFNYQPASIWAAARAKVPVVAHVRAPVRFTPVTAALARRVKCFVTVNRTLTDVMQRYPRRYIREEMDPAHPLPDVVARTRQELCSRRFLIGSVGRLDEQKGYEYLIQAARIVCDHHPSDLGFVIAGDGPLRASLQAMIERLRLSDQFRLLGFRRDPEVVTAACDRFVCSSLWEGGPTSVIDAMAAGTPVVSTRVGIVPEVIAEGESGWLAQPRDAQDLARAIEKSLLAAPDEQTRIVEAARINVEGFADQQSLAAQFEEVLDCALRPGFTCNSNWDLLGSSEGGRI